MKRSCTLALLTAATVAAPVVLAPAVASGATLTVDAGVPRSYDRAFRKVGTDANAFFPSRVTIHVGDRLAFRPSGFHTIHLLSRRGGRPIEPFVADIDRRVNGYADDAGTPFWFNGQPRWDTAKILRKSRFGKRFSFSGSKPLLSGLQGAGTGRPMVVTFTRPGTFTFLCDYHHGMKGTVRVLPRSGSASTAGQVRASVTKNLRSRLRTAATLKTRPVPKNVVNVGVTGPGGVEFYDFSPKVAFVKAGSTVTFRMSPGSMETHAVAAGPGMPDTQPKSWLGQIADTFETVTPDPRAVYPSEPSGVTAQYTAGVHGNSFWSSGILDRRPTSPFPVSRRITFPTVGNYTFSCLIHKYMHTTVVVER
jgi:plastocyanin